MTIKDIRELTGLNKKEFAAKYNIPYRSVQNWELGESAAPEYFIQLLGRVVQEDLAAGDFDDKLANVYYAEKLNEPIVVFSGTLIECARYADAERAKIKLDDRVIRNYYIKTKAEEKAEKAARERYDALTEAEKHDYIVVNGKKYIRKIYEATKKA